MATMAAELNKGMSEGLKLEVSKVIRASRDRVWEAWTTPEVMRQWFGPEGKKAIETTLDLRVGGSYRIAMESCQEGAEPGRISVATGVYREIVPKDRVSFTWNGNWSPDEESLLTVTLRDAEVGVGGTEVTIRHERFLTTASMSGHEAGWVRSLGKLAVFLEG